MIKKTIFSTIILFLFALISSLNFTFAQGCGPLILDSIGNPGEYTYNSLTESGGIRNGPGYNGATIYYPTNATPPFSGMAIVPGYVSAQSSIQNWGPFLASHGIVAMTIGTNSLFDQPEDRRDALLDALITLKGENSRSGSPLLGNLDITKLAVGGWSMGGGGAQLAARMDTTLKAVMALCPWLNPNQLTPATLNHPVPILFFSGENDGVAPPASHANVHYNYTPSSTHKMLFEIASGDHSVANNPNGGSEYVGKIAIAWLKNFLVGDTCYCPLVLNTPPTASNYLLNINCSSIASVNKQIAQGNNAYQIFPNPCNGSIQLKVNAFVPGTNYQIISMTGTVVNRGEVLSQTMNILLDNLAPGIYAFNLRTAESSTQTRFIVQ
jgi:dienelactone hydrolase